MNKKLYHIEDLANDFETVCCTTAEDIQKFSAFLAEIFGDSTIVFKEITSTESCLYEAYANYLIKEGFKEVCKKEIEMLKGVHTFLNIK
jgi:hypothetical protein